MLLHGWPSSSHQYRNLIPALSQRFHVIAPDYQGFGGSDHPDPATYHYSFDAIAATMEKFLAAKGFDHYGLFVQDYGGPVGFRIVGHNPKALDWLIIQNTNAYEVGFSPAWDGFRKALWINRTPESEAPLAAFNTPEAIKNIVYLGGAGHPELIAPEAYESDAASVAGPTNLGSSSTCSTTIGPIRRAIPPGRSSCATTAQDADLLGAARPVLHPRRRRSLSAGSAQGRNLPVERRAFRDRGQPALHRRPHHRLLRQGGEVEVAARHAPLTSRASLLATPAGRSAAPESMQ